MIDHVDIRVSDLQASERFYTTVFAAIGKERTGSEEGFAEWAQFGIHVDDQPITRRLHIAFYVPSHELVHAFHEAGTHAGYRDDGAPGPRRHYGDEYYGGFLLDPDGNSVEAVNDWRKLKPGVIDHLWLRTRDVSAIRRFYTSIGLEVGVDEPDHVQFVGDRTSISFVTGEEPTENVHLAFTAASNEEVDAFHAKAIEAGYNDNGAPGERAAYHPGYYGAFVLDPDGNNVEAVNHNR